MVYGPWSMAFVPYPKEHFPHHERIRKKYHPFHFVHSLPGFCAGQDQAAPDDNSLYLFHVYSVVTF